jgi:hypothetical protein
VFSSQLIGAFRIMLRSKAMVDAKHGYFGDDAPVTGIPASRWDELMTWNWQPEHNISQAA